METYQKGGITIDYYGECFGMFDECITGFCEPFRNTKSSLSVLSVLSVVERNPEDRLFIYVYRLGEDGDLKNEGNGMLSVWALRARSYKTRADA